MKSLCISEGVAETYAQNQHDHSWRDVLEQQERDRRADEEALRKRTTTSPAAALA